jgi:hypothetical protein
MTFKINRKVLRCAQDDNSKKLLVVAHLHSRGGCATHVKTKIHSRGGYATRVKTKIHSRGGSATQITEIPANKILRRPEGFLRMTIDHVRVIAARSTARARTPRAYTDLCARIA